MKRLARASSFLTLSLGLSACGGASGAGFVTASELPREPRRPDGVVVDPETVLPAPQTAVPSDIGLATLRPPLDERLAREITRAFFRAIATEDLPALASLLTESASFRSPSGGERRGALEVYRARAARFDYFPLVLSTIFDEASVEIYRSTDFGAETSLPVARPHDLEPTDIVLRVPITTTHTQAGRVLGDEILLIVRRDDQGVVRIRAIVEEFLGW